MVTTYTDNDNDNDSVNDNVNVNDSVNGNGKKVSPYKKYKGGNMRMFLDRISNEILDVTKEKFSGDIIFDNEIHRFGKNNRCWYVGKKWLYNGKDYFSVSFGSWNLDVKKKIKSWDCDKVIDDVYKNITLDDINRSLVQKKEKYRKCVDKWKPIWESAKPDIHSYNIKKGIGKDCYGARVSYAGELLIPMYGENGFRGVQRIFIDVEKNEYVKRFSYGVEKKGSYFVIGDLNVKDKCYVAEGYATAATIYECIGVPVVVSFDAGNIIDCIKSVRKMYPEIKIMIASDRDIESGTGEKYAKKAVAMFKDVYYRMPEFRTGKENLSDFNDLFMDEGREMVINILKF